MWKKELVEEACRRFKGTPETIKPLGGFYNNVFEYERDGEACVLKLMPIATKDKSQLHSELKWVNFLRSHGIAIPKQILSTRGQSIETIIELPIPCCAISFRKGEGKLLEASRLNDWSPNLLRRMGQVMGKMHSLSQRFLQKEQATTFEEWDEGEIYHRDWSFIDRPVADRWSSMLQRVHQFPKTSRSYGLINNDFHHDSILISNTGNPIVVDFNRVKYHWFTYDIAIVLFHALESIPESEHAAFKQLFTHEFMSGYFLENILEDDWRQQLDFFVEFRLYFIYLHRLIHLHRDVDAQEQETRIKEYKERMDRLAYPTM
ncbi:phosphotransferase enzyme family protein [Laceyella sacchari]|uniref:Phosphotransferase n=1 Tax=Laceyella sacchari TaxID=37482 RepID=A0ABY5U6N4_LACSH|nr:phosphotransferase [Laceyella sacchari]TCW35820.1 Ser/Thr protein kinase RdoA (MazF antagonist) [Laceyella sacchari]UWE03947.1 phosphotransferase [Laceyella sacchari]